MTDLDFLWRRIEFIRKLGNYATHGGKKGNNC